MNQSVNALSGIRYLSPAGRVQRVEYLGQLAWLKRTEAAPPAILYALLGMFSSLFKLETCRPVRKPGGEQSLSLERRRIQILDDAGIRVPEVLGTGPGWHILSDAGISLRHLLHVSDRGKRRELLILALQALRDVHIRQAWLSQAFCKNIVIDANSNVGFVDFEDDPRETLPLATCQARDLLLFLSSAIRYFENDMAAFSILVTDALSSCRRDTVSILMKDCSTLARMLPRQGPIARFRDIRLLRLLADLIVRENAVQQEDAHKQLPATQQPE